MPGAHNFLLGIHTVYENSIGKMRYSSNFWCTIKLFVIAKNLFISIAKIVGLNLFDSFFSICFYIDSWFNLLLSAKR